MTYGASLNTFNKNSSIYGTGFSPIRPMPFADTFSFNLPMFGDDFSNYMTGDFMATFQLFNMLMMGQMPKAWQANIMDSHFNTKTNLPGLKGIYNGDIGNKLANIANKNAQRMNSKGLCARGTNKALELANLANGDTRAASAYQVAGKLRHSNNFTEVNVAKDDLKSLPAGCVVVWNPYTDRKGKYHQHGHICVTLGNGQEASDSVYAMNLKSSSYAVFVPKGINKKG